MKETIKPNTNPNRTLIICGALAGLIMLFLSLLLENSFRWFIITSFSITPDGVLLSSIFGVVILTVPVIYTFLILHRNRNDIGTAVITLVILALLSALTVYAARGTFYASEVERIVFERLPQVAENFIGAKIILATWVPFLLACGGLFLVACSAILLKPRIVKLMRNILEQLRRFPASPQARWWFWLLTITALARIAWILLIPAQPAEDFAVYDGHAVRLAQGLGYVTEAGEPTAYWPVGYPFFLSLLYRVFGHSIAAAKTAGVLLGLASTAITYLLGKLCAGEKAGRIAAVIAALLPGQVFYANLLASETLFTPLLLLSIYLAIRYRKKMPACLAVGVIAGVAALVRPTAIIIPAVFFIYYLLGKEKPIKAITRLVLILVAMFVILAPWAVRNYRVFGEIIPVSTNGGVNFFIGNNPHAKGVYAPELTSHIPGNTEIERNTLGYREGIKFITSNPGGFLILGVKKMYYMYGNELLAMDWSFYSVKNRGPLRTAAIYISQAAYLLLMAAAIAGLRIWFGKRNGKLFLPLLIIGALSLVHFVYFGESRFHFPLIPLFSIFAAMGCLKAAGINADTLEGK